MIGISNNGELKNVVLNDDGSIPVKIGNSAIEVKNTSDKEITLNASIQNLSTEETVIAINKKVTSIGIANYSETANVTVKLTDEKSYQISSNLAVELSINSEVTNITLSATENDTKIQLIVKGVEK